jgi:hypothetical protein
MALTMRPTGLGPGVYKHSIDCSVFAGAWNIGRIYERRGFSDTVRFFWSLHGVVLTRAPGIHTSGNEPSLEMAKARLKRSRDRWLEWSEWVEVEYLVRELFGSDFGGRPVDTRSGGTLKGGALQ